MTQVTRELIELAERVEKVEGADRRLDVLIGCAVGYVPDTPGCEWAKDPHWQYIPVPKISERIGAADKAGNVAAHWEAPVFTASIDAATTLFPPNTMIRSGHSALAPDPSMFFCDAVTEDGRVFHALALTEANARVAAALRARSAATL
jgi:hypothetical protein